MGTETTLEIIDRIQKRVARDKYVNTEELNRLLCEEITDLLAGDADEGADGEFSVPAGKNRM